MRGDHKSRFKPGDLAQTVFRYPLYRHILGDIEELVGWSEGTDVLLLVAPWRSPVGPMWLVIAPGPAVGYVWAAHLQQVKDAR